MKSSAPAWSIMGRHRKSHSQQNPGPGSYHLRGIFSQGGPNYGIGAAQRSSLYNRNDSPGPGAYQPVYSQASRTDPKTRQNLFSFGKSSRPSTAKKTEVPGPGNYQIKGTNASPSFSFSSKARIKTISLAPGPGQYTPSYNCTIQKSPNINLGSSKRISKHSTDTPGPGSYTAKSSFGQKPKWGFSSQKRINVAPPDYPGPGTYKVAAGLDKKAFSMGGRTPVRRGSQTPGPGSYNPNLQNSGYQYSMGQGRRSSLAQSSNTPGPGSYKPKVRDTHSGQYFGKQKRNFSARNSLSPAPGAYTPKYFQDAPSFSMGGNTPKKKRSETPGPGTYQQIKEGSFLEISPSWNFGGESKKSRNKRGDIPGPGMYDVRGGLLGPHWGFGASQRKGMIMNRDTPGPGSYEAQIVTANLPKYTSHSQSRYY